MFKTFPKYLITVMIGCSALLIAQDVSAAQLFFRIVPNNDPNDRATIIEARVDPKSKRLNVVEGIVKFDGVISDKLSVDVETGGSALTLWPTLPKYNLSEKTVRFAGGVPQGFINESLLFRLRISSALSGTVMISWIGGTAYLNDGQGTKEPVSTRSISVNLEKETAQEIKQTSLDGIPPKFEAVDIGKDESIYDGKYFVSLNATDESSGVMRYEIKEGESSTEITDGVYILKDQERKTPLVITAYDQAGNSQTMKIPARLDWVKNVIIILLIIAVLVIVFWYVYKKNHQK